MREFFRVPLHADHPPVVVLPLDAFDDAVWSVCHRAEAGGEPSNGLMMKRVHGELLHGKRSGEARAWCNAHVMHALAARPLSVVRKCPGPLTGNVLHERTTKRDVHDLNASADCEGGYASSLSGEDQSQLQRVSFAMNVAKAGVRKCVIALGVDVFAASEQQAVHAVEQRVRFCRIDDGEDVRAESGRVHGIRVCGIRADTQHAPYDFCSGGDGDGGEQSLRGTG